MGKKKNKTSIKIHIDGREIMKSTKGGFHKTSFRGGYHKSKKDYDRKNFNKKEVLKNI